MDHFSQPLKQLLMMHDVYSKISTIFTLNSAEHENAIAHKN